MRSFIYASTAMNVVTGRQGRAAVAGMNLLREQDPLPPRFACGPAAEQPRCRLDSVSRCLRAAQTSSCRLTRHGEHKHHERWLGMPSGGASGSAPGA
jgi:hypothetical protein